MKDLYARLGIEPEAGDEEIAKAAEGEADREAYASILLNPEKRAVYDRTRATVSTIGVLRHRLGLDSSGGTWFLNNYPDFAPQLKAVRAAARPKSKQEAAAEAESPPAAPASPRKPKPPPSARSKIPLALIVIGAVAAIAILAYVLR